VAALLLDSWGSTRMVSRGRLFDVLDLPGFVAVRDGEWLGHAAYDVRERELEVALLESVLPSAGAGSALLAACVDVARQTKLSRVWLVTTNDNTDALRFYQRRGFRLIALHVDAVTEARRTLKREIPEVGEHGIPLRDELELELPMTEWDSFVERYSWPTT
jgi:N-acetylglutamate synthase-like GNAT family acetyltransferase